MPNPAAPKQKRPQLWQLLVNAVLGLGLIVVLALWFDRHLLPFFAASLYVGGTMSLFVLWQLVRDVLPFVFPQKVQEAQQAKLLGRPWLTKALLAALAVAVAAYFLTSSIWIRLGGEQKQVTVQVREGGTVRQTLTATTQNPIAGKVYFCLFPAREWVVSVSDPRGYSPLPPVHFGLNSRLFLDFPGAIFVPQKYHVIRLVCLPAVYAKLPPHQQEKTALANYDLIMTRNNDSPRNLGPMRQQVTWVGASAEDLDRISGAKLPGSAAHDEQALLSSLGLDAAQQKQIAAGWAELPVENLATEELQPNDRCTFQIVRKDTKKTLAQCTVAIDDAHEIQTALFTLSP